MHRSQGRLTLSHLRGLYIVGFGLREGMKTNHDAGGRISKRGGGTKCSGPGGQAKGDRDEAMGDRCR